MSAERIVGVQGALPVVAEAERELVRAGGNLRWREPGTAAEHDPAAVAEAPELGLAEIDYLLQLIGERDDAEACSARRALSAARSRLLSS
jgi:hypothetical protein